MGAVSNAWSIIKPGKINNKTIKDVKIWLVGSRWLLQTLEEKKSLDAIKIELEHTLYDLALKAANIIIVGKWVK